MRAQRKPPKRNDILKNEKKSLKIQNVQYLYLSDPATSFYDH